ncbi:MAG: helix-turn-helix domain-containing protein [Pseudomonadota bacterium]
METAKPIVASLAQSNEDTTRQQLMDAAEVLFVDQGIENVSLRAIGRHAGQRNQSALQYHFENRDGLLNAILRRRMAQLEQRRSLLVDELLKKDRRPSLHDCTAALVRTPFSLCAEQREFRDIFGLMGAHLLHLNDYVELLEKQNEEPSLHRIADVTLSHLASLPQELVMQRIEATQSSGFLAITQRARRREAFTGTNAELFEHNLVDQLSGMLAAPVSESSKAVLNKLRTENSI